MSSVSINLPGIGLIETRSALTPSPVQLIQTHKLQPLLSGNVIQDGYPHWKLRQLDGNGVPVGLGAVGHRLSRGEMVRVGGAIVTFRTPLSPVFLERPSVATTGPIPSHPRVDPKDEVIFSATAHINPMHAGAQLLVGNDLEGVTHLVKKLGSCVFVIQGVFQTLSVQCVQEVPADNHPFSKASFVRHTFTDVVATVVALYLPDVDPDVNVVGPHAHAMVHAGGEKPVAEAIAAISFSPRGIIGGGHVNDLRVRRGSFWYHPIEGIRVLNTAPSSV